MRVLAKITSANSVAEDTDEVIIAFPLPSGTKINRVSGEVSIVGNAQISINSGAFYGLHGYILPVENPDAGVLPDVLWDEAVEKEQPMSAVVATEISDMDTANAIATPRFQPGEVRVGQMMDEVFARKQVYARTEMMTYAKQARGFDPATDTYFAADFVKLDERNLGKVMLPAWLVFGISSPTVTQAATPATPLPWIVIDDDAEWTMLRRIDETVEMMWKSFVGLTELGAGTPYANAALLIGALLDQFLETDEGRFVALNLSILTRVTIDVSYEGAKPTQLSAE